MDLDKLVEHIAGEIMRSAHRGVDADHAVEFFRFFVDRPKTFMAQRQPQSDGRQHQADEL